MCFLLRGIDSCMPDSHGLLLCRQPMPSRILCLPGWLAPTAAWPNFHGLAASHISFPFVSRAHQGAPPPGAGHHYMGSDSGTCISVVTHLSKASEDKYLPCSPSFQLVRRLVPLRDRGRSVQPFSKSPRCIAGPDYCLATARQMHHSKRLVAAWPMETAQAIR